MVPLDCHEFMGYGPKSCYRMVDNTTMPIEGNYLQRYEVCGIFHGHRMDPLVRNGKVDILTYQDVGIYM